MGSIHILFAVIAITVGAAMFVQRKGGRRHRNLGYLYSVALLLVNLSALLVYRDSGRPGPFHILAVISLATLSAGVAPALLRRPRSTWINRHAYFMSWSYVGLLAAGVGQITTKASDLPGVVAVGLPSVAIVLIGGFLIHTRVPNALLALTAGKVRRDKHRELATSVCG